jgi:DNA-binding MarR family transcriptional regulator
MSFQAMAWAIKQPLQTYDKMVLLMLSNYADSQGKCWPSLGKLAEECGMSQSQVRKCVAKLEKLGMVRRQMQMRTYGQTSNMYHLNLTGTMAEDDDPPIL